MKNKFLALAAFGAAALGSAIVAAPAQAQINPGPSEDITVNVTVPEILYLRTITEADIALTADDLAGTTVAGLTPAGNTASTTYYGSDQSPGATLDTNSPFANIGTTPITKPITAAYIVWSNSQSTYTVSLAPGTFIGTSGNLSVGIATTDPTVATGGTFNAEGLTHTNAKDIVLDITPTGLQSAGTYTGTVTVSVVTP